MSYHMEHALGNRILCDKGMLLYSWNVEPKAIPRDERNSHLGVTVTVSEEINWLHFRAQRSYEALENQGRN